MTDRGRVRVETGHKRVRGMVRGEVIVDTDAPLLVWEKPYYPTYYFPADGVRTDVLVDTGETSDVDVDNLIETPNDVHAGEIETSTSLAIRPHLVRMDRLQMEVPAFTSRYLDFTSKRGVSWYAHTHKISSSGVMGDPTKASVEKGEKMWELIIAHLVIFVDQLKTMTLKEIYQRKY